eukprot:CAMPEP_0178388746 /NCGR_PEP_ID=MMETSP0689_2-20121128/9753_1 /TAXON_ID=160604 /ORGANISM="Amphidinium massartii, Strain CS-259" /LENGTH=90 /DNA_ID=CAMNT_0020009161 /DNA_START=189 /DNA_END=458 /DNA_ORIENTATION=+
MQLAQAPTDGIQVNADSAQLQQSAAAPDGASSRVAASGIATLAAAAVLMANTRRNIKSSSKVTVKAFESERGVQDPVGFFDPLGFTADGS